MALGYSDEIVSKVSDERYDLPSPEGWFVQRDGDVWTAGYSDGWLTDPGDRYNRRRQGFPSAESAVAAVVGPPR